MKCDSNVILLWLDRQLIFVFRPGDFVPGDSGASVVNQERKALGILYAAWITEIPVMLLLLLTLLLLRIECDRFQIGVDQQTNLRITHI
jgi:hypothetical protein